MQRLPLLIAAALVALHAQAPKKSFRQRDVRFFTELFANWIESAGRFDALRIHNNQIARELALLAKRGVIKANRSKEQPTYLLTSTGLISCVQTILQADDGSEPQYVFFKIYFLSNYADRIRKLLQSAETAIPTGLKLEIDPLLDWKVVASNALLRAQVDKKRLEARIKDAVAMPKQVRKLLEESSWGETVSAIENQYPYELNSVRSLSALCATLPQEMAVWELTEGSMRRARQLWSPLLRALNDYISELERLLRDAAV